MAFSAWYSYFNYQKMLFKIFKVLTSLQSYINKHLVEKHDFFIIIYLDNIFIYT